MNRTLRVVRSLTTSPEEETIGTSVFIPGAGDVGWYWHLVEAALRAKGHDTVAPDLPSDDDSAGQNEYAGTVVEAVGNRTNFVVGQSIGGFTAPLAARPDVPTKFAPRTEDRFLPPNFLRRLVAERLEIVPDEIAAGHCVALSRP